MQTELIAWLEKRVNKCLEMDWYIHSDLVVLLNSLKKESWLKQKTGLHYPMNNDLFEEIENTAECLFEKDEADRDYDTVAKEIASRYPGSSWSSIRLQLEYIVSDIENLAA